MTSEADGWSVSDPSYLGEFREQIRQTYRSREADWVIAFSGGRDATAVLQLIWEALEELDADELTNPIHVVNVATGVDSVVAHSWVERSLVAIDGSAEEAALPIRSARLMRELADSFWVKLIGHGLQAPRQEDLWCAEGLRRRPIERYIRRLTEQDREVVLVLGARDEESHSRSRVLSLRSATPAGLKNYTQGARALVYTPIECWTECDTHNYLDEHPNPWGLPNVDLLELYQQCEDESAPTSETEATPMCGDCRVGCWVCTVFTGNSALDALFEDQPGIEWLRPLFELRAELSEEAAHLRREHTAGAQREPQVYSRRRREHWLRRVLETNEQVQALLAQHPDQIWGELELIDLEELGEIRRIWRGDEGAARDRLPEIYEQVVGQPFPDLELDTSGLRQSSVELLQRAFGDDELGFELSRRLLSVEQEYRTMVRRAGLYEALEDVFLRELPDDGTQNGAKPSADEVSDE